MPLWVSDQGSHFKNQVPHPTYYTVAYSRWVNGTVESVMHRVRAVCLALLSKMKLGPQDGPNVIGTVITALNESPLPRLGKRDHATFWTPLEVFTGLKPVRSQMLYTAEYKNVGLHSGADEVSLDRVRALQVMNIELLQIGFDAMHNNVRDKVAKNRRNKKTNLVPPNFSWGDFVLVRSSQDKGHKLSFRWLGPKKITGVVSGMVYDVTSLMTNKTDRVHAARMMLYRAQVDGSTVSKELMEHVEHTEANNGYRETVGYRGSL